jgi:hypothetical protein
VRFARNNAAPTPLDSTATYTDHLALVNTPEAVDTMTASPEELSPAETQTYYSQAWCQGQRVTYDYFYQLAHSQFCLMIRGDTLTSNRLFDCLHYGVLPVILSDGIEQLGLPFVDLVPWHEFSFFLNETSDPVQLAHQLQSVVNTNEATLRLMRRSLNQHYRGAVWQTEASRVFDNTLVAAVDQCLPEELITEPPA